MENENNIEFKKAKEKDLLDQVHEMAIESLSPEKFTMWQEVRFWLLSTRNKPRPMERPNNEEYEFYLKQIQEALRLMQNYREGMVETAMDRTIKRAMISSQSLEKYADHLEQGMVEPPDDYDIEAAALSYGSIEKHIKKYPINDQSVDHVEHDFEQGALWMLGQLNPTTDEG